MVPMDKRGIIILCIVLSIVITDTNALYIDGCPMFGCRPSGSFSFYLQLPGKNASVGWASQFDLDPVPSALGCVSNAASIVCQSNGVFSKDQGYVSLVGQNGTILWRDNLLHFPTLPLLDNIGDVTGSDGQILVHYDQDGTKYPVIPCNNMKPLFNMAIVGDSFLLLVSENGNIVVRQTNGIPVGLLTLNATVGNKNGTFVPVAQPAVNSNEERFYVLTAFMPQETPGVVKSQNQQELRVYAIDVHHTIDQRITIAWYYSISNTSVEKEKFLNEMPDLQSLLFDRVNNQLYVKIMHEHNKLNKVSDAGYLLLVLNNSGSLVFERDIGVHKMTKFITDHCENSENPSKYLPLNSDATGQYLLCDSLLWLLTTDSVIVGMTADGKMSKQYNLNKMFDGSVVVTSYISTVRNSDVDNDTIVFAIGLTKSESSKVSIQYSDSTLGTSFQYKSQHVTETFYIVAIDASKDEGDKDAVKWMVQVPNNMRVTGQITGSSGSGPESRDQLIAYSELTPKSAVIFSIY